MTDAEKAPCRNPACLYGRPEVSVVRVMRHVFPMLCAGCVRDSDEREQREARDKQRRDAVERVFRGVREPLRSWSFGTYPDDRAGREAVMLGRAWADEIAAGGEPHDFLLFGPVGRGKTGLAWSIARWLAEEHAVAAAFVNFREMLEQLRESYDDPNQRPDLRHLRGVRALVIDDLGAERPTEWAREQLASLIDWRNGRAWTVYTSNYSLPELGARLGHDDPIVGQRIVSRISQGTVGHELSGRDRRA